ncbi:thioesterase [Azospirillum sp. B21]|uniref:thioesterase family protein n=1 Tax=Azospirillum sp. B21 TaxID=2607496 RepID=UPI0011EDDED1|nr:thioesterase [Azospirillum sp. B21]KAA0575190.1 thioesterase [Azospirillum sp. B21]
MTSLLDLERVETVRLVVDASMTADAFARDPDEHYPQVLATPVMIAEMERACAALLRPVLQSGELSVGARLDVSHTAPTPVGGQVRTSARFTGREGALYWFNVWSEDAGGKIGQGRHARAILPQSAIESRAAERAGS